MSSDTQHLRRRRRHVDRYARKQSAIAAKRERGISWMLPAGWFAGGRTLGERCCAVYGHKVATGEKCPRCGWIVGESRGEHMDRTLMEIYKVQAYELRALDGLMEQLIAAGPEPPCGSPANPHLPSDVALRGGRPYCVNCGWRP